MQIAGEEIERLRRQIMEQIDLTRTVEDEEVYQLIEAQVRDFARERMLTLGEREAVVQTLFYSLRKLDVLQELLEDPAITEIMVNGAEHIFYEKAGRLYKAEYGFSSKEKLNDVIQQMAGYSNRMVNEASPIVDTRLADGSRVNIVLEPVAIDGRYDPEGSGKSDQYGGSHPDGKHLTGSGRSTENTGAVRLQYFHFRGNRFRKDYLFECTFPVYSPRGTYHYSRRFGGTTAFGQAESGAA